MSQQKINTCSICKHSELKQYLTVADHFLTKEQFQILVCTSCGLGITSPQPDSPEISKYYQSEKYISHHNKKKTFLDLIYRKAQRFNFRTKLKYLSLDKSSNRVLDYGAGSGAFINFLVSKNIEAIGIEPSKVARRIANVQGTRLYDVSKIKDMDEASFDRITMWHVLEHIHNLEQTIANLSRLLKPKGEFVVAIPNFHSKDALFYKQYWAALDVPRHLWHFTPKSLSILFKKAGFEVERTHPLKLDAFYVSILSEKYRNGSITLGILNGFKSNLAHNSHNGYSSNVFVVRRYN